MTKGSRLQKICKENLFLHGHCLHIFSFYHIFRIYKMRKKCPEDQEKMIYSKDKIWDHVDSIDFLEAGTLKKWRFERLTFAKLLSECILECFLFFFSFFEFEICESLDGFLIHRVGYWVYSPLIPTISSVRVLQFNMYLLWVQNVSSLGSGCFSPLGSGCISYLGSGCISSGFRTYLFWGQDFSPLGLECISSGLKMCLLRVQKVSLLGSGCISFEFRMYPFWVQDVSPLCSGRISSGFRMYLLCVQRYLFWVQDLSPLSLKCISSVFRTYSLLRF